MMNEEVFLINTPNDYMNMSQKEKEDICHTLVEEMLTNIILVAPNADAIAILNDALEDNIKLNIQLERFEVCALLKDIRTFLNE